MAVVDASVILSSMLPGDPHHEASKAWLVALVAAGNHFTAPAILLSEVAAPISRAHHQPELAGQVAHSLAAAPFAGLVPATIPLASRAAAIVADYQIRGCYAVYVALAESLGEELITLDRQQIERAKAVVVTSMPGHPS
jgi:predicted nucleic acid-binding protein